ncbi:MAG: hypothetical protein P9X22_03950 [Candidatus Zapsychrus exili]|nr:hypothetical protein [Candidatus Zapsychrus exili]
MKNSKFMFNKTSLKVFILTSFIIFSSLIFNSHLYANNLSISNVSLGDRDPSSDTIVVNFDISWDNSWKTKINHDATWITIRLHNPSLTPTNKKLCQLTYAGLNPQGISLDSASVLEAYVSSDKKGAFLRPSSYGHNSSLVTESIEATIDYSSCGFSDDSSVYASVFGIEMVYVPEGSFYAGDNDTSTACLDQGSSDSNPWNISSESAISISNPTSDGYHYVSAGNTNEDATGASFTLLADFPKGYKSFYAMKYEVTEEQWVEFFNSLSSSARTNRDITDGSHKNTDTVSYRNTISCFGSPLVCSSLKDSRALSYVTWMDLTAFLDWAALRPITELEYEKMSRGAALAVSGEFAWGATDIIAATTISGSDEDGTETIANSSANVNYNNTILSGGDTSGGADYTKGPLRVGIFAVSSATRTNAGAGYYGNMELSGNLRERIVTIGNAAGRSFIGSHGDGVLSIDSSYEGNATNADWPGIDDVATRGITNAGGSGFKGGSWEDQSSGTRLRTSDRNNAAETSTAAYSNAGGRGARTYDGE